MSCGFEASLMQMYRYKYCNMSFNGKMRKDISRVMFQTGESVESPTLIPLIGHEGHLRLAEVAV